MSLWCFNIQNLMVQGLHFLRTYKDRERERVSFIHSFNLLWCILVLKVWQNCYQMVNWPHKCWTLWKMIASVLKSAFTKTERFNYIINFELLFYDYLNLFLIFQSWIIKDSIYIPSCETLTIIIIIQLESSHNSNRWSPFSYLQMVHSIGLIFNIYINESETVKETVCIWFRDSKLYIFEMHYIFETETFNRILQTDWMSSLCNFN